nr:putative disease resistance protein At4g19050 [Coffea arabica]XP_027081935.1 putative disease resistance protein At4g19050 [Coffea arabica]
MVRGTVNVNAYHRQGYGGTANLGLANVLVHNNDWHGIGNVTEIDSMIRTLGSHRKVQQLITLLLDETCLSREDPNNLLDSNRDLQILGLFSLRIVSLPQSFSYLKKLNVLMLRDCEFLEEIDDIRELLTLTVLEVSGSCLIKSIPENFFQQLTRLCSLHFSDLQIEVLPKSFYDLTKLRWFILKGCSHLTKLQSLRKCEELMVVDLSGAALLPVFPEKNLRHLPKLKTLNLSKTTIKYLPIFHETGELTHLSVSGCRNLKRLPSIQSLTNLQVLDLSWSAIKEFQDKSLHNNSNLKVLDLSGIGIPSDLLPSNISKPCEFYLRSCSKIEYINIAESPKDLEVLDISGASNLVKIEEKFFESLVNVRVLNLSETKVKDLPALAALQNLRRLLLSGCLHLEKLPSLTSSKLEEIDLSDCKALTMIEDEFFKHLHRLRRLVLSKSKITRLPDLNSLLNLEELNLSGVKSFKKVDFIEHMSKLQDLNLSETLLEQLPTLSSLKSLKHLSLRGCGHLESIPPLEALHRLETLDLSQTAVRHLPSLGNLSNLHILLLSDCSNLEDFKKNKMLDMSGAENLPCGISRLTQLEHIALPSTKKNNEAAESNKVISWQQNPGESHWFLSIVDGIEPNIGRSLMFRDGSLFLEFLQSNPSLLDANSNHFHLSIHPIEVHDGAGDLLFKKDELIFRDVYLLSRHYSRSQGRLMEIHHLNTFPKGAEAVLGNAEYVFLFDNLFLKSLSDLGARNIKMMKGCWIEGCQNMGSVIGMDDSVESSELGNALEILWISNAFSLRRVYSENLQNLKCLYLDCCPKLSRVFSSSHLLQKLEILHVKFYENLETLFKDDVEEQKLPNLRTLRLWELPALKCIGCIMPSLQLLEVGECPMLGHVLTSGLVPEKLEVLKVKNCHALDKILEGVASDYNKLPQLGEVHLQGLPKLTSIGIEAPLLRSLEVRDCSLLIHVISSTHKPENLEVLKVRFCDNLETLFAGTSEDCGLPSLDTVQLWGLPKLVSIGTTLPPLRKSIIRDCPKLTIPMS